MSQERFVEPEKRGSASDWHWWAVNGFTGMLRLMRRHVEYDPPLSKHHIGQLEAYHTEFGEIIKAAKQRAE